MRDKTHMEQVERWAKFVRNNSRSKWKPRLNAIINAQFEIASRFFKKMAESDEGRGILKRLREEKIRS